MIQVIAPNIMKITIAVMIARTRLPVGGREDALDRFGEPRCFATLLAESLDDFHRPEHFAGTVPRSAMRSWLLVDIVRTRRPRMIMAP